MESVPTGTVSLAEVLDYLREDCYMDKRAAARYLGRSVRWVEDRMSTIPYYKADGGGVRFRKTELDRWMEAYRIRPDDNNNAPALR